MQQKCRILSSFMCYFKIIVYFIRY